VQRDEKIPSENCYHLESGPPLTNIVGLHACVRTVHANDVSAIECDFESKSNSTVK